MKEKKLVIDCVNKIKIEKYEEFEDSIFSQVYERAALYAKTIVAESIAQSIGNMEKNPFLIQESFHNIIPFLGDRGMGKSSAMLSFALFLQKYNKEIREPSPKYELSKREIGFYLIPRIDAAMLIKGENLLDIILAYMWKIFEKNQSFENTQENVRKGFSCVKESYELYMDSIAGKEKKSIASVRNLKDLSRCLNLAQDFRELVNNFLPCVSKNEYRHNFLVIVLDDLDTATEDAYAVLEQIRLFLMLPNIIILVSADLGRLYLECNKYFLKKLVVERETLEREKNQIRNYAQGYLSKILPSNKRIYMPDLNINNEKEYQIAIPKFDIDICESIKDRIYKSIYHNTGIMLFPHKWINAILKCNTLRDIVNILYTLENIHSMEKPEKRAEETIQWLVSRLEEYIQSVINQEMLRRMRNTINAPLSYLNNIVSEFRGYPSFTTEYNNLRGTRHGDKFDYQTMLKILQELTGRCKLPDEVYDFLILLYSIRLSELCVEEEHVFLQKVDISSIWRTSVNAENNLTTMLIVNQGRTHDAISYDKVQMKVFAIRFTKEQNSFKEWLLQNKEEVQAIFSTALFCDQNFWFEEEEGYIRYQLDAGGAGQDLEDDNKMNRQRCFRIGDNYIEASIDCLFKNMLSYDKCLQGFVKNIFHAYCESIECSEAFEQVGIEEIFELKNYTEWKKQNEIDSLRDLLPFESVDVMQEITIAIRNIRSVGDTENMTMQVIDKICRQVSRVIEILNTVEQFYEEPQGQNVSYSNRIKQFLETCRIENMVKRMQERENKG